MSSPIYESIVKALSDDPNQSTPYGSLLERLRPSPRASMPSTPYSSILKSLILSAAPSVAASPYASILSALAVKPKVFVSYHHLGDRVYYELFTRAFADTYDACHDNSVDRKIDSNDSDYVIRQIRENNVTGSSCTIVLCGAATPWRKFVDWEIKATLDKQHALIGINLPSNPRDSLGQVYKPTRLQDNIDSGYAIWLDWDALITGGPNILRSSILAARCSPAGLIRNSRTLRRQNG
jgi:hypothetical protein